MNATELISVILPVYNAEDYLIEAIESIIVQSHNNFELILIDDGSSDGSYEICKRYAEQDQRITLLKNEVNLGVVQTLKKGVAHAKGAYIARMDADDISIKERFKIQLHHLKKHPEIAVLGSSVGLINEEGRTISSRPLTYFESSTLEFSSYFTQPFYHGSVMMRSNVIKEHNYGSDSKAEDFELWLKLNSLGYKLSNLPQALYLHRINQSGVSQTNEAEQKSHHNIASKKYLDQKLGLDIPMKTIEIINNRPLSKVTFAQFKKAYNLYLDFYSKFASKEKIELVSYYKRQVVDIHLQSIKMSAAGSRIRILSSLLNFGISHNALDLIFKKLWRAFN